MKQFISIFITALLPLSLLAQTPLSGTHIGSCSFQSTQSTDKAFDDNADTWFKSCIASGGWVGLDLGTPHVITSIDFRANANNAQAMLLGLFEGANNADFGDAIPLYLIRSKPLENTMNRATVSCSKGFRYVRYVGPADQYSRIAELRFYGSRGAGDNSKLFQVTNLPTVVIRTTNANPILDKENYVNGIASIISNNGTNILTDSLGIRGRGNASWDFPKKPYRIKFKSKQSPLGLPSKEKSWTLINNYGDKTLMRNLIANEISRRLGMHYTPAATPVDVILNGEFIGTYNLSDQIEVDKNRVDIEKDGGYLIEIDSYAYQEALWFESARNRTPVTIKYPKDDEITAEQTQTIKTLYNTFESSVYAPNYTSADGYRKYIDVNSLLQHFIVGELSGNTDTYWSTYMYKYKNDQRFYVGPVWDFDLAFENDGRTYPINNLWDYIYNTRGSAAQGVVDLINRIFSDASLRQELTALWSYARYRQGLTPESMVNYINNQASLLDQSQKLNFMRWNIMTNYVHQNPRIWGSYEAEVDNVRNYVKARFEWMDKKIGLEEPLATPETLIARTVTYVHGNTITCDSLSQGIEIRCYSSTGQQVNYLKCNDSTMTFTLPQGIYVVRFTYDGINKTTKIVVG